jgi:hypothetical protein
MAKDPISQELELGKLKRRLLRKYNVRSLDKIPAQTLHEESPVLHSRVYGKRKSPLR